MDKINHFKCSCCEKIKIFNDRTLICECKRIYCDDSFCWIDCNDEYFRWGSNGEKLNEFNSIFIEGCDNCIYSDGKE
jgi:hypothetical protein